MLSSVEQFCRKILTESKCRILPFHNVVHTEEVVQQVQLIGKNCGMGKEELELIKIAAWFHDVGFCEVYKGHEEVSLQYAKRFLVERRFKPEKIDVILSCIQATKIPQGPKNKYAEILSDGDIYHISTDLFFYKKWLLRREWELVLEQFYTDLEWHELNLKFLQSHTFFTSFGKSVLMDRQRINEDRVKILIDLYGENTNQYVD